MKTIETPYKQLMKKWEVVKGKYKVNIAIVPFYFAIISWTAEIIGQTKSRSNSILNNFFLSFASMSIFLSSCKYFHFYHSLLSSLQKVPLKAKSTLFRLTTE